MRQEVAASISGSLGAVVGVALNRALAQIDERAAKACAAGFAPAAYPIHPAVNGILIGAASAGLAQISRDYVEPWVKKEAGLLPKVAGAVEAARANLALTE